MATEKSDFFNILSESSKLTRPHSRHFLALSVLFLFPFYFSVLIFPILQHLLTNTTTSPIPLILFFFLYAFTLLTLALCATSTITYSLHHVFFGRPVKLIYALKSLSNSLLRLYATFFCALLIMLMCLVGVGLIVLTVIRVIESFGFEIDYSSVYFEVLSVTGKVILGLGLLYLYVNWALAPVIVVAESNWGLEPLRRSTYLVKGMRGVVVCLALFYGGILGMNFFGSWVWTLDTGVLKYVMFVVQAVMGSLYLIIFFLQSVAANTVLYMNCKALRGELAEEFAQEYVSLPFDEENVPRVVSVVQP